METLKIGLPCTPSKHISHEIIPAIKVRVTFGGGMGGTNKNYYCLVVNTRNHDFYYLTLITGEEIQINPKYIVEIKKANLVKLVTDITEHTNYHKVEVKKHIKTQYIELNYRETYDLNPNEYVQINTDRVVHTENARTF